MTKARFIADIVTSAPEALNTLDELAAALGDDENFASTVTTSLATKADNTTVTAALATKLNDSEIKSANYTAVSGDNLVISAGSITITLPATPSAGDYVIIKDGTGAAADTPFTVARNGSNIAGDASDLTFDKNFAEVTMTYIDATTGWTV